MQRETLLVAAVAMLLSSAGAAEKPELYSTDFWEIPGPSGTKTWVEIHNSKEARTSGIAHVSVHTGKKAPLGVEPIHWLCDHIAITTEALKRSVTRPFKTRGAYPERYFEALHRWEDEQKQGKAIVCSTSIQDWLKEHR